MKIPLFDLTRQYAIIRQEILAEIDKVISSGRVILGENVQKLEKEIAELVGVKHGIGVANGSDALYIALKALGVGEGDYVITTPYTFFATASCITRNNATPIFVDIDPQTYNINLDQVEDVLKNHPQSEKIKALIPVHLFGQTVDLERLEVIRERYGIRILEDCAQSIGSTWKYADGTVKKSGSIGDVAIFSFFPTKNLGAYGDGGMIVTDDDKIAEFCRSFRVHGSKTKYVHEVVGINSRLDEIQAVILRVKLKHLNEYIEKRRKIAKWYGEEFKKSRGLWVVGLDYTSNQQSTTNNKFHLVVPPVPSDRSHVFHQYVVRFKGISGEKRNALRDYLSKQGIGTSIYYPMGLHQQKCFAYLNIPEGFLPETEKACEETLALPIFPELMKEEVEYVVNQIISYLGGD
ncbi:Pleiotropic regulatory protein [Kosmotoga arenicorallina S304]|uniref:Pleiotropic regulatory protein n=1 Tax=Kosmotoga arenicorallina S304 TaxID=1453497 RepID=A0A176JTJ1_9BACT|nr:DegT/DnrJ/EryC1/StrS family aminotransferase [Kosmotoga arenicorallina]OAA26586.1 Pleiotropic regulatory protein [Kosmotoga arenicorallina S304]